MDRWLGHRSRSRTSSRSPARRPGAAARRATPSRPRRTLASWRAPPPPARADRGRRDDRFSVGVLTAQLADPSVTTEVRDAVTAALAALTQAGWQLHELTGSWLDQLRKWEETLAVIVSKEAFAIHASKDTSRYSDGTRAL